MSGTELPAVIIDPGINSPLWHMVSDNCQASSPVARTTLHLSSLRNHFVQFTSASARLSHIYANCLAVLSFNALAPFRDVGASVSARNTLKDRDPLLSFRLTCCLRCHDVAAASS